MISQRITSNIEKLGDKPFLVTQTKTLCFSDIACVAASIEEKIPKDKCIGIMIQNPVNMIPALIACWRKSSIPAILDPSVLYDKYLVLKKLSGFQTIIADFLLSDNFANESKITIEAGQSDEKCPSPFDINFSDDSIAILLFTSGSTGIPKCVPLSIGNIWSNIEDFCRILNINENDVFLSTSPLFYAHALYNSFLTALLLGATVIYPGVLNIMNVATALQMARENGASIYHLTPSMMQILLMMSGRMKEPFPKFKHIICGTAKLDAELKNKFEQTFDCTVTQQYGMTETLFISVNAFRQKTSPVAVGIPVACEIRITDNDGNPLGKNQEGKISVKSKSSYGYYFNQQDETATSYIDGWFFTGDIGFIDDNGDLTITGRCKEMIKKGGITINPHEINSALCKFAGVVDCATVPIPDPVYGEEIYSAVTGTHLKEAEILEHCSQFLPQKAIPRRIFILQQIPKTSNGKTDLSAVTEIVKRMLQHSE